MSARKLAGTLPKVVWTVSPEGKVRSRPLLSGCHDQIIEYDGDRLPDRFQDRGTFGTRVRAAAERLGWTTLDIAYSLDSRTELSEPATAEFVAEQIPLHLEPGDTPQTVERKRDRHARRLRELTGTPRGYVRHQAFDWAAEHGKLQKVEQIETRFPPDNRPEARRPLVMPTFPTNLLPEIALYRRSKQTTYKVDESAPAPDLSRAAEADAGLRGGMSSEAMQALRREAAEAAGNMPEAS